MAYEGFLDKDNEFLGVFIPLPRHLADQFPPKGPGEDPSPSHVTFLILGPCTLPEQHRLLLETLGRFFRALRPGPMVFQTGGLGYFDGEDKTVAHVQIVPPASLYGVREALISELQFAGLPVDLTFPEWVPHTTLGYLDPGEEWDGPVPEGEWQASWLELWGCPKVYRLVPGQGLIF
jgi:2'-5' RNA ligase